LNVIGVLTVGIIIDDFNGGVAFGLKSGSNKLKIL
jgi:hypothetical protein